VIICIYKEKIHFKFNNFDFNGWKIAKGKNYANHFVNGILPYQKQSKANGSMV
jgi:hypothetical protein